jgi:hypothetical protein
MSVGSAVFQGNSGAEKRSRALDQIFNEDEGLKEVWSWNTE